MKKLLYLFLVFAFLSCGSKKSVSSEKIYIGMTETEFLKDAQGRLKITDLVSKHSEWYVYRTEKYDVNGNRIDSKFYTFDNDTKRLIEINDFTAFQEVIDVMENPGDKSPFLAIVEAVTSLEDEAYNSKADSIVSADSQKTDVSYLGVMRGIVIDKIAEEGQSYIGKDADRDGKGVIAMELLNENNTTLVFQYKFSNKEVADNYKANKTKALLIAASPNIFSKRVKSLDIIVKKRYYYNNKIILEITVYPNEWND